MSDNAFLPGPRRPAWIGLVLSSLVIGSTAGLVLWCVTPVQQEAVVINVRWKPDLADADRALLESRLRLVAPEQQEESTWRYRLLDISAQNIRAIVEHPRVDDTQGLDRANFRPENPPASRAWPIARRAVFIGTIGALVWRIRLSLRASILRVAAVRSVILSPRSLTLLVLAGPAALFLVPALGLAARVVGWQPFWQSDRVMTLVEAAYEGDRTTVHRLSAQGADLNAAESIDGSMVTPLEAAVLSGDLGVVQVLLDEGALVDGSNRQRLVCLAVSAGVKATAEYLRRLSPETAELSCEGVRPAGQ